MATVLERDTEARARRPRSGPVGIVDLEKYAETLEALAGKMHGLCQGVQDLGVDSLAVEGWLKAERATGLVEEFCDCVQIATIRERRRRR